jgi:hypothetical protein
MAVLLIPRIITRVPSDAKPTFSFPRVRRCEDQNKYRIMLHFFDSAASKRGLHRARSYDKNRSAWQARLGLVAMALGLVRPKTGEHVM